MLTVKLCKGHTVKIVEAVEVNIYAVGQPEPIPVPQGAPPAERPTNKVREISVEMHSGKQRAFYISNNSDPAVNGFAPEVQMWECAYIENAHGATTERVQAY